MRLYDHPASGNCLKVRVLLRQLGISYETVVVDLFAGETREPEHLARNANGRVPVLELDSGEMLPESAAIMLYLAEGTPFLPADPVQRAQVHRWLFFEQNQVEPSLAVADIALHGYVHCAGEAGGVTPAGVAGWLDRVEATPGFVNDLAPFPEHARR